MRKPVVRESPRIWFSPSIRNESVIRKFTVVFLLVSILPLTILMYLYLQMRSSGSIHLTYDQLNLTLIFCVLGILLGYFTMRNLLQKLVILSGRNQTSLERFVPPDQVQRLGKSKDEIEVLQQAFEMIEKCCTGNIENLEVAKRTLHGVLSRVGRGLTNVHNIDIFLHMILETLTDALGGKVAVLILKDRDHFVVRCVHGVAWDRRDRKLRVDPTSPLHTCLRARQPIHFINPLHAFTSMRDVEEIFFKPPVVCAPLTSADEVRGLLSISGVDKASEIGDEIFRLMDEVATLTALTLDRVYPSEENASAGSDRSAEA